MRVLVARPLVGAFMSRLTADLKAKFGDKGYPAGFDFKTFKGSDLAGTIARHPIYNHLRHSRESGNDQDWERALEFYARPRPSLPGDCVTTDRGTGHVHMSPDHDRTSTRLNTSAYCAPR